MGLWAFTFDPRVDLGQLFMIASTIGGVLIAFAVLREQVRQLRQQIREFREDIALWRTSVKDALDTATERYDDQQAVIRDLVGDVQRAVGVLEVLTDRRRGIRNEV